MDDNKTLMDRAEKIIKALRCFDAPDEPDNLGCARKTCPYRDVDGACNVTSMGEDAAIIIDALTAQLAAVTEERDAAVQCIHNIKDALGRGEVLLAYLRGPQGAGEGGK